MYIVPTHIITNTTEIINNIKAYKCMKFVIKYINKVLYIFNINVYKLYKIYMIK